MSRLPGGRIGLRVPRALTMLEVERQTEHWFLAPDDDCAYLTRYLSQGGGQEAAASSRLIRDFKCRPTVARSDARRGRDKQRAIGTLANWLRSAIAREQAECCTWVPIPPSRRFGDPDFDDRLVRTLIRAFFDYDVDIRALLGQTRNLVPDHAGTRRVSAAILYQSLHLNFETLGARPLRERIVLFDDVLTSGKHYRCCEQRLREALPTVHVAGVFLMRRMLSRSAAGGFEPLGQASAASTASPAS